MILDGKKSQHQIAQDLGIPVTTLSWWVCKYNANPKRGIAGSLSQTEAEIEFKMLKKKHRELEEEKAAAY